MKRFTVFAIAIIGLFMFNAEALGQCVSLTTLGSASTQNFDTLSNTAGSTTNNLTITGWFMTETGGGARDNEQYGVDTGASNTGDTYSYGAAAATDRALGGLRTGTLIPNFGACFTNNTGATVNSLAVAYTGEEWRLGTAARTDQINFEYSTNATSLVTGTWTNVAALNFVTPDTATVGAKNGNAAADRTALSSTISSLSIANGATFWIRWTDIDATGADDGLAVDDFSLTPNAATPNPNLTVSDVSANEGNAGTTVFTFNVNLSTPAPAGGVTFDIATADGTATVSDNDYVQKSLTAQTIPAGSSSYTFDVLVNGDTLVEPNETFFVNVTNAVNATVTNGQGQGTIQNDDVAPPGTFVLSATNYSANEGNGNYTFTVNRTGGSAGEATVSYSIQYVTATNGTCGSGADSGSTGGTVTFADGETTQDVVEALCNDAVYELPETLNVNLTGTTAGTIGSPASATVTITDNDPRPSFEVDTVSAAEGDSGTTNFTFTVRKNGTTEYSSSVQVDTASGTAQSGSDFNANSALLTFAANETTKAFTVVVNGDMDIEEDEDFIVNLTNPTNATISVSAGFGVIENDDFAPTMVEFEFADYKEDESQTLTVYVRRTGDPTGTTTVQYSTQAPQNLGGYTAVGGASCTSGVDYIASSGTLTFKPDEEFASFDIPICSDLVSENDETFPLILSDVTNGTLGKISTATVTINDTASQFTNTNQIGIGFEAYPYPSPINVTNAPATISKVRVTLFDFFDFNSSDLDVLLVGPQGQQILLMADAGGATGLDGRATITFDDEAGVVLPQNAPILDGKYEPTSWVPNQTSFPDAFEAPNPPPAPYNEPGSTVGGAVTLASVFGGTNPNGEWRLYVRVDGITKFQPVGIRGAIFGGWGLQLIAPTAASVSVSGQVRSGNNPVSNATVMISGGNLTQPKIVKTNSLGNYTFDGLTAGQVYVVTVVSKRYNFPQSSIILNVVDNIADVDFEAEGR